MERVEDLPVRAQVEPGEVRAALAPSPPEHPEAWSAILADLDRVVVPGTTHWQSPELLRLLQRQHVRPGRDRRPRGRRPRRPGDALVDRPGLHRGGDARPRLAGRAARPARALPVDRPRRRRRSRTAPPGANLCALLAARERAGGVARHADLVAYTSAEAHSSVEKGAPGRRPPARSAPAGAGRPGHPGDAPRRACGRASTRTWPPGGSRSSCAPPSAPPPPTPSTRSTRSRTSPARPGRGCTSTPPTPARRRSAPSSGRSTGASSGRTATAWTRTSGCSPAWSATRSGSPTGAPLIDALSVTPEYLRNQASDSGAVIDYRDWHVPLGRRFRALRLWFVLRHYGAEGLRETVRAHVAWAQELAGWIDDDPRFERVGPTPLNLVCFRHRDGDDATEALLARAQPSRAGCSSPTPGSTAGTPCACASAAPRPSATTSRPPGGPSPRLLQRPRPRDR